MFSAWITNSVSRALADEVFIAYDSADAQCTEELGFITVRRRGDTVNIGLLAVSDAHRRRGIAKALLSRAVLWSMEEMGNHPNAVINVITQGENAPACACYEGFGFEKVTLQEVYHVWLPDHLASPIVRADQGPIPFCKQHFTGKELTYAAQVLSSGLDSAAYFTMLCSGRIRELIGVDASERVVMVPSGTAALEMAALLCELTAGDEVIMPSYTFSSTANCFVLRGATPIFVDIRPDTLNIDESLIEAAITQRTRAICAVHYAGVPCEMDTICAIAKKHNLYVIEDAAQGWKLCETLVLSVHFTVSPAQQVSCRHTKVGNWVPSVTLVASLSTTQRM
jgi:predicted GNAT family acetyltransferase